MNDINKKEYDLGDKVKIISLQSKRNRGDCEIGIGDTGVIVDIDENNKLKYYYLITSSIAFIVVKEVQLSYVMLL